jgi:hypothetical protein
MEAASHRLHSAARELNRLIQDDEYREWPAMWKAFLAAGGVTRVELCRWMVQQNQIRPTVCRQHLRLVANKAAEPAPTRRRLRSSGPPLKAV